MTPRHLETHRDRYAQPVQRAMALLDRITEGQPVDTSEVNRALRITGDLEWDRAPNSTGNHTARVRAFAGIAA